MFSRSSCGRARAAATPAKARASGLRSPRAHRRASRRDRGDKPGRERSRHRDRDPAAARGGAAMSPSARVLVIDDEPAIHRFLAPALVANDYVVLRADTGGEALRRIAADAPDVIVLDLGLPDIDGKEV